MTPEPTINEMIEVAARSVRGAADTAADFVRGSDYESLIGPSAIIWTRQAARDTDLFNSVNFHTADGEDLTRLVERRYGKTRVLDTRGTGFVVLKRPESGTEETFWAGTHISLIGNAPQTYRVTEDTPAVSTALTVRVPIEAVNIGTGVAVNIGGNSGQVRIDDTLVDPTWYVGSIYCTEGSFFEKSDDFRVRVRRERREARVGQSHGIIEACNNAGAQSVVLFRSDYAGDYFDAGLNRCYVGNLGYTTTPELLRACFVALMGWRVAGDQLQVGGMNLVHLDIDAQVYLYDSPSLFDLTHLERIHGQAILQYLNGSGGRFGYTLDGLRSAISRHTTEVQRVVLRTPLVQDTVVSADRSKNFPLLLNRYVLGKLTLRYLGG